jgi:putative PIG3 family NAD(P)H quinone oxidoreductase
MRCAVIESFGKELSRLVIQDRGDLKAEGENILVRVSATALNRADLLQRRGLYPAPAGAPQDVPGLEFVGYVEQIGGDVTEWKGGERVFGIVAGGAYAEQVITHQRLAVSVPDKLSDTEAAAVPEAFIVAHDGLVTLAGMRSGDLVLIHAVAGGVGTAAVQLAHLWGAHAIGTAGIQEKLTRVSELAPFFGVNYRDEDFQQSVEKEFGKNAVDLILDCVGAQYLKRNVAVLKDRGRLVLLGLLGGTSAETPLAAILFKRIRIMGTTSRSRPLEEKILATRAFAHEVLHHFEEGRLKPVIDSVFPFERLHEATDRMEKNQNVGKIVLTFG